MFSIVAASSEVGYIYRRSSNIDENMIHCFSELGLSVDLIDEKNLYKTDFSNYKFLFVGDERLRNEEKFLLINILLLWQILIMGRFLV